MTILKNLLAIQKGPLLRGLCGATTNFASKERRGWFTLWKINSLNQSNFVFGKPWQTEKEVNVESKITIAIADPNTLLREGLKRLLHDTEEFVLVAEATNDAETLVLLEQLKPDVLLLDREIPKLEAIPIQLAIKTQNLPSKVLILSLFSDESQILNSARAGARGYILKTTPFAALVDAIRDISRGRIWADRQTRFADTFVLLAHRASNIDEPETKLNPFYVLSRRELQILNLIGRGATNEEIAKHLAITPTTVKTHASKIFDKLSVKNRTEATLVLMQARSQNGLDNSAQLFRRA